MSKPPESAAGSGAQPVKASFSVGIGYRIEGFQRILSYLSATGMIAMMIPTIADVFARVVLHTQLRGSFEFTGLVMAFVIYLGVPYAQAQRAHIKVTLLVDRLPPMIKQTVQVCVYFFCLCIFLFLIHATFTEAIHSFRIGEYQHGSTRFPIWPF